MQFRRLTISAWAFQVHMICKIAPKRACSFPQLINTNHRYQALSSQFNSSFSVGDFKSIILSILISSKSKYLSYQIFNFTQICISYLQINTFHFLTYHVLHRFSKIAKVKIISKIYCFDVKRISIFMGVQCAWKELSRSMVLLEFTSQETEDG